MKRIKLVNRIFYCIFLLGFLLFMASGFIFSTVDKVTPADKRTSVVVKPEDTRYIGDDTIEYHVKIRASAGNNNALAFVSRHQEVEGNEWMHQHGKGSGSICRWKTYILYKST